MLRGGYSSGGGCPVLRKAIHDRGHYSRFVSYSWTVSYIDVEFMSTLANPITKDEVKEALFEMSP